MPKIKIDIRLLFLLIIFILTSNRFAYCLNATCSNGKVVCSNGGTPYCPSYLNGADPVCGICGSGVASCLSPDIASAGIQCSSDTIPVPCSEPLQACIAGYTACPNNANAVACCSYGCCPSDPTQCKCSNNNQCYPNCSVQPTVPTCDYSALINFCNASGFATNIQTCSCGVPIIPATPKPTPTPTPISSCQLPCSNSSACGSGKYCDLTTMCCVINPSGCFQGCYLDLSECGAGYSQCVANCCVPITPEPTSQPNTISITLVGNELKNTNGLNIMLGFSNPSVVQLDSARPTFSATDASQLLTEALSDTSNILVVWDGTIINGQIVITAMLKPGQNNGTSTISVTKIEATGGVDITNSVSASVNPPSFTNTVEQASIQLNNSGKIKRNGFTLSASLSNFPNNTQCSVSSMIGNPSYLSLNTVPTSFTASGSSNRTIKVSISKPIQKFIRKSNNGDVVTEINCSSIGVAAQNVTMIGL